MSKKENSGSVFHSSLDARHFAHAPLGPADLYWVQIKLGKHDADHFISPEERLPIAMARQ